MIFAWVSLIYFDFAWVSLIYLIFAWVSLIYFDCYFHVLCFSILFLISKGSGRCCKKKYPMSKRDETYVKNSKRFSQRWFLHINNATVEEVPTKQKVEELKNKLTDGKPNDMESRLQVRRMIFFNWLYTDYKNGMYGLYLLMIMTTRFNCLG